MIAIDRLPLLRETCCCVWEASHVRHQFSIEQEQCQILQQHFVRDVLCSIDSFYKRLELKQSDRPRHMGPSLCRLTVNNVNIVTELSDTCDASNRVRIMPCRQQEKPPSGVASGRPLVRVADSTRWCWNRSKMPPVSSCLALVLRTAITPAKLAGGSLAFCVCSGGSNGWKTSAM